MQIISLQVQLLVHWSCLLVYVMMQDCLKELNMKKRLWNYSKAPLNYVMELTSLEMKLDGNYYLIFWTHTLLSS